MTGSSWLLYLALSSRMHAAQYGPLWSCSESCKSASQVDKDSNMKDTNSLVASCSSLTSSSNEFCSMPLLSKQLDSLEVVRTARANNKAAAGGEALHDSDEGLIQVALPNYKPLPTVSRAASRAGIEH